MAESESTMPPSEEQLPSDAALLEEYNSKFRMSVLPLTVLFGVEIVFGLFGNLLTMYVFFFRYKPCNFRYFVLGLALTDLISCLTTIPAEMVSQIYWYNYPVPPVCHIKAYFNQFTVCSEAAFLTIIAVDRYRKVCKPFGWQIKQHVAKYSCIVIFVVAGMFAIPTPIFWGVHSQTVLYEGRNITVTICEKDEKYRHTKYPLANIMFNQSVVAIGLVCMFILYILVTKKLIHGHKELKRHRSQKPTNDVTMDDIVDPNSGDPSSQNMSNRFSSCPDIGSNLNKSQDSILRKYSSAKKESKGKDDLSKTERVRRKTMIMMYLTSIFIVTTVMYGILLSVVAFGGTLSNLDGVRKVIYFFFLRLYFINHVINPVFYGIMDAQFRIEMYRVKENLLRTCSCICLRNTPQQ